MVESCGIQGHRQKHWDLQHHYTQMKAFFGITEMRTLIALLFFLTPEVQKVDIITAVWRKLCYLTRKVGLEYTLYLEGVNLVCFCMTTLSAGVWSQEINPFQASVPHIFIQKETSRCCTICMRMGQGAGLQLFYEQQPACVFFSTKTSPMFLRLFVSCNALVLVSSLSPTGNFNSACRKGLK